MDEVIRILFTVANTESEAASEMVDAFFYDLGPRADVNVIEMRCEEYEGRQLVTHFCTSFRNRLGKFKATAEKLKVTLEEITWPEGSDSGVITVLFQGEEKAWSERHKNAETGT